MGSFVRIARNLFSSSFYSHLLKECRLGPSATKSIQNQNGDLHALSVVDNIITQQVRSEKQLFLTSVVKTNKFRYGRTPVRVSKAREANAAVELALNSVVKVFTVSCSPNYLLPWQNKSQRETMGSGQLTFFYSCFAMSHSLSMTISICIKYLYFCCSAKSLYNLSLFTN